MKKLAIGCGVVLVLFAVAAAAVSYFVYRKVSDTVSGFSQLATVPDLERSVRNRSAFTPPASGELTDSQIQRFVRVQSAVRGRLGVKVDELRRNYRVLLQKEEATAVDVPELVRAYRDVAIGYVDAKRAQVDALNDVGLSLEEYRWVRTQVYAALGIPMMDLDVARIVEDIQSGRTPDEPTRSMPVGPSGPKVNQDLVAPHRKMFEDNAALAFFGL